MLLVLLSLFAPQAQAAVGKDVAGQFCSNKILSLDPVCLGYSLTTCGTVGVALNITYQDTMLWNATLNDIRDFEQCQNQSACVSCIKFASVTMKPTYARFCPKIVVTCTVRILGKDVPVTETQTPECIELGADCNATGCISCASRAGCGWCAGRNACLSSLGSKPYCDSCANNSVWYPEDTCERPTPAEALSSGAVAAAVVVPLTLVLLIAVGCFCFFRKRAAKHTPTGGPIELQSDENQSYLEAPVVASPMPDSPSAN